LLRSTSSAKAFQVDSSKARMANFVVLVVRPGVMAGCYETGSPAAGCSNAIATLEGS
jgi:hypothetical protein